MQVTLKGISKRGKERIKQHGDTFCLLKTIPPVKNRILVESLNRTFNKGTEFWLGEFQLGIEVDIILEKD